MNLKKLVRGTVISINGDEEDHDLTVEASFPSENSVIVSTSGGELLCFSFDYLMEGKYVVTSQPFDNIVEQMPVEVQRLVHVWDGKKPEIPAKHVLFHSRDDGSCYVFNVNGDFLRWAHWCEIPTKKTLSELIKEHGDKEVDEDEFLKLLGGES